MVCFLLLWFLESFWALEVIFIILSVEYINWAIGWVNVYHMNKLFLDYWICIYPKRLLLILMVLWQSINIEVVIYLIILFQRLRQLIPIFCYFVVVLYFAALRETSWQWLSMMPCFFFLDSYQIISISTCKVVIHNFLYWILWNNYNNSDFLNKFYFYIIKQGRYISYNFR